MSENITRTKYADNKLENDRFLAELEKDKAKWRVRRRIAVSSFLFSVLTACFYMLAPLLFSLEQAAAAQQFNSIIITLIGFFSTIVITYFGVATYSDVTTNDQGTTEKKINQ